MVPEPTGTHVRSTARSGGGSETRTGMAYDQIRLFVLLLQRRLEPPDLDRSSAFQLSRPRVPLLYEAASLKIGVPALYDDMRVAFATEDVRNVVRESPLDQSVEASGADRHKNPHACVGLEEWLEVEARPFFHEAIYTVTRD